MQTPNITDDLCEIARGLGKLSFLVFGWGAFHLLVAWLHLTLKAISW